MSEQDFQQGSITRIRLENFLTYENAQLFPGPRLNVVIGPNGTGKSSIVCAVFLCLGGSTKFLGRGDHAKDFIQHQKEYAEIEIDLYVPPEDIDAPPGPDNPPGTVTILRRIGAEGTQHNKWYINGRLSSQKEVRKKTHELRVDVDSLCEFLPQDRVGEFSLLTPQQLLRETQQCIGGVDLVAEQDALADEQKSLSSQHGQQEQLEGQVAQLEQQNSLLERDVHRMQQRQQYIELLELMATRKVWLEFEGAQTAARDFKSLRDQKKAALREAQEKEAPLRERLAVAEKAAEDANKRQRELHTEAQKAEQLCNRLLQRLSDTEGKWSEEDTRLIAAQKRAATRQAKIARANEKVSELQQEIEQLPSQAEAEEAKVAAKQRLMEATQYSKQLRDSIQENEHEYRSQEDLVGRLKRRLAELGSAQEQTRQRFSSDNSNRDALKAEAWIRENRHRLQGEVIGPCFLNVQVRSPLHAQYLETQTPRWLMDSFVFENENDRRLFTEEVKNRMKLRVNYSLAGAGVRQRPFDRDTLQRLARFGIQGYMDDVLDASPLMLQHLANHAGVASVLVGNEDTHRYLMEDNSELKALLGNKFTLFTPQARFTCKPSKYSSATSTAELQLRQARFLVPSNAEDEELPRLQQQLEDAKQAMLGPQQTLQTLKARESQAAQEQQRLRQQVRKFNDVGKARERLLSRLQTAQNNVQQLIDTDDLPSLEAEVNQNKRQLAKANIRDVGKLATNVGKFVETKNALAIANVIKAHVAAERAAAKDAMKHLESTGRSLRFELDRAQHDYEAAKTKLKHIYKKARSTAPMAACANMPEGASVRDYDPHFCPCGAECAHEISTGLPEKWAAASLPDDLNELEEKMAHAEAARDNIVNDPEVLRRYNERKERIRTIRDELEQVASTTLAKQNAFDNNLDAWATKIRAVTQKIDSLFSTMFGQVVEGCRGNVELWRGRDEVDINEAEGRKPGNVLDWGVHIRVQFRTSMSQDVLNGLVHSGGERSTSTILYFLSLQRLCRTPIRMVDEMNQGMDEVYERSVFRLVNETVASTYGPQMFLITPKLLQNLEYHPNTRVHIVFNAHYLFDDPQAWNVEKFLRIAAGGGGEEEEEEGEDNNAHSRRKRRARSEWESSPPKVRALSP